MSAAVMSTSQRQRFKDTQEVDLAYSVPGLGRFRCNVFQQRGTIGLVLRVIPMQIRTIDELGLPPVLKTDRRRGARARPRHRHDRQRQEHDAGRADRLHQSDTRCGARDDRRGSDRVPPPRSAVDRQPARGVGRHAIVRPGAAQRAAAGSRRHPRRRDARLRDDRDRACWRPRPAISSSRRCTRSTRPKRSTASSPSSRRTSRSRCACSWPASSRPSSPSGSCRRSTARDARRRSR